MALTMTTTAPPVRRSRPEQERIDTLVAHFITKYRVDPATVRVVKAPLRICPLGAHIDHQLGPVTGMTIDQSILLAFAPATDDTVYIESLNFEHPRSFSLNDVPPYQTRDWGNYIRGAVLALQREHQLKQGLVGMIEGNMPIGGLSSSAAVTIAYLLALETINELDVSAKSNIALVRYTENEYIGLNNGILDQSVILFSQANHLTLIDPQTLEISQIPTTLQPSDFEILVVYSGVTHVLVGTDYNNRVAECRQAAEGLLSFNDQTTLPDPRLRQVDPKIRTRSGPQRPPCSAPSHRA